MEIYFIKDNYGNEYNIMAKNIEEAIIKYKKKTEEDDNEYIDNQIIEIKLIINAVIL